MELRVIGAGLPRTGTTSLKYAIEKLTGGSCYHMTEVFPRLDTHIPLWLRVLDGDRSALDDLLDGFSNAVDWPASSFWVDLVEANPQAIVILSSRRDSETWWKSIDQTVWEAMRRGTGWDVFDTLVEGLTARLGVDDLDDAAQAQAAYEAYNDAVRAAAPPGRFVDWQPGYGWGPLCTALHVDIPDEPFPNLNPTAEFRAMSGWD